MTIEIIETEEFQKTVVSRKLLTGNTFSKLSHKEIEKKKINSHLRSHKFIFIFSFSFICKLSFVIYANLCRLSQA